MDLCYEGCLYQYSLTSSSEQRLAVREKWPRIVNINQLTHNAVLVILSIAQYSSLTSLNILGPQNISNSLPAGLAGRRVPGLSEFWGWDNQDPDIGTHMFPPCGAPYRYLHRSTPQKLLTSSLYFSCVMRVQRNVVEGMLRGNSWYDGARELLPGRGCQAQLRFVHNYEWMRLRCGTLTHLLSLALLCKQLSLRIKTR